MLAAALMMLVGGCSDATSEVETARPSPSPPEFINGGPCPGAELARFGPRAGCVTMAHNEDAALFVYAIVDDESIPVRWRVRYESDRTEFEQALDAGNRFSYPRAIAAIDVDDDGNDEWLLKAVDLASHGTNWQRLQAFVMTGARLDPIAYQGEPLSVNVGGTSRMGEGARCESGHFVLLRAEAKNRVNTIWEYSERVLEISGLEAELITRREGRLRLEDYNDPDLNPYYQLECGDLVYP